MGNQLEYYNSDNILIRSVVAGVLNLFNKQITYEQVWENNVVETVRVPWLFDMGNSTSERFIQDNYTFFGRNNPCLGMPQKIDGNFDMIPRGVLRYTGTQIDSDNICNRFVQGISTRVEDGKITTYRSFLYSIPLTVNFECTIFIDNFTNMLKIEQGIREKLFRNKSFYVMFRGMKIGCCLGMPDTANSEKTTEFSFSSETGEQHTKLTFNISVETYQPVWDKTMEMDNDNYIKGWLWNVNYNQNNPAIVNSQKELECDDIMIGGTESKLRWITENDYFDDVVVNLQFAPETDIDGNPIPDDKLEWQDIETGLFNQSEYWWKVPKVSKDSVSASLMFHTPSENVVMVKEPEFRLIPSAGGKLTEKSFVMIDPGYFMCSENEDGETRGTVLFDVAYKRNGMVESVSDAGYAAITNSRLLQENVFPNFDKLSDVRIADTKTRYAVRLTDYKMTDETAKVVRNIKIY